VSVGMKAALAESGSMPPKQAIVLEYNRDLSDYWVSAKIVVC